MAATAKTPQFSVKLGWNKELKRNDRVILRVALHRIPVAHINVDVQKDRVRVDTLKNTRKFVLETQYPAGVNVDENGASAVEEYGYLIVQIPIKSPESEAVAVPKQQKAQMEVEKQKQRQLKKQQRKAAQAAEAARATAIANMAGVDAAAVMNVESSRDTGSQTLKRRKRGDTAENERKKAAQNRPMHAWIDAPDGKIDQDAGDASLYAAADAHADEDDEAPAAMDEPVESGQYEELRQQYDLVKDELGEEERAELERELQELYEMEADPTGRGVEGAVLDAPLTKKQKKKKKRQAGSVTEVELSSALEIAEKVAARHDDEQEKAVSKEEAKRAWQEDQKTKQRERKARKKQAKAALVQELRRGGQPSGNAGGDAKQGANEEEGNEEATTKRNEGDIVTLNSRKKREKTKDVEAKGTVVELLPPKKRKRLQEPIHSPAVQDDDKDKATAGKSEPGQTLKKKTKKQKKTKDNDATAQADMSESFRADSEKEQTGEKAKLRKKKKKDKSASHARAESSHNPPQSPTERKGKRVSDGILKEPRSSGKQLKRVSFSPKPETKSIPAIPYTRNKWLW